VSFPFILDIALGLVFVYLIFSLLASEIQEILTTILQWRAEHLRKSIEILLGGDADNSEDAKVMQLANQIYANPLIKSMNQEAKGFFPLLPRKIIWSLGSLYRLICQKTSKAKIDTGFGDNKRSGPSYIDSKCFSGSLVDTLKLSAVSHKLTEIRLNKFQDDILNEVRNILVQLQAQIPGNEIPQNFIKEIVQDYEQLKSEYNKIVDDFAKNKSSVDISVKRMRDSFDQYIENFQALIEGEQEFLQKTLRRLKYLRKDTFDDISQAVKLGGLKPTMDEIVQSINYTSAVHQEIISVVKDQDDEIYQTIQGLVNSLPQSVIQNLEIMAKNAKGKAKTTEESLDLLRKEIETNFDQSMERAAGVYKRNAKGVAFLIGCILAVGANADTFYIINRLSKDSVLRETIVTRSVEIAPQTSNVKDVSNIDANQALNGITLPVGWSKNNLQEQMFCKQNDVECNQFQIDGLPVFKIISVIMGWFITGIAIAMGAPFWFDLLGRIVNVRNTGRSPKSVTNDSNDGDSENQ